MYSSSPILILDDDHYMCETLRDILENSGFHADYTHSVEKAVELMRNSNYRVLIIEFDADNKKQYRSYLTLKLLFPDIRMIVLSTGAPSFWRAEVVPDGEDIVACFSKPFCPQEIIGHLQEAVEAVS